MNITELHIRRIRYEDLVSEIHYWEQHGPPAQSLTINAVREATSDGGPNYAAEQHLTLLFRSLRRLPKRQLAAMGGRTPPNGSDPAPVHCLRLERGKGPADERVDRRVTPCGNAQ